MRKSFVIISKIYLLNVLVYFVIRLIFLGFLLNVFDNIHINFIQLIKALFFGLRYDLVVISFSLLPAIILLIINDFKPKKSLVKFAFLYTYIISIISFFIAGSSIPYYTKFSHHLDLKALEWFSDPDIVISLVFSDIKYWILLIPFLIFVWIYYRLLKKIFFHNKSIRFSNPKKEILAYFFLIILLFFFFRGKISTGPPLQIYDAYTEDNVILNELKLNPVFVLEKNLEHFIKNRSGHLKLMDDNEAIKQVRKYFNLTGNNYKNPIARQIQYDSLSQKKNVVLILMESMAAWKMKFFGNQENRTPFLDSLFLNSIAFTQLYSAGIHTSAGVYSSNVSYPVLFEKHPMKTVPVPFYYSIPVVLTENGYQTVFFVPHQIEYDNIGGFLIKNGYQHIYSKKDYPKDSLKTLWGVDDRFLLNFALKKIDSLHQTGKPFLSTILTITDHEPYYVPDFIKGENIYIRLTRYADFSLHEFFDKASKKTWFKNTIFILMGDHGETKNKIYPMPLTYNHIPGIIYYKGVKPQIINNLAGQIDMLPTLMNLLKIDYINTSFGVDLFTNKRPYIYFNHDKFYGILDDSLYLIMTKDKTLGLYKYKTKDRTNYLEKYPAKRQEMETYLKAHLQTADYILRNDLQKVKE